MMDFKNISVEFENSMNVINEKIMAEKLLECKVAKGEQFDALIKKIKIALTDLWNDSIMSENEAEMLTSIHKMLDQIKDEFTAGLAKAEDIVTVNSFDIDDVKEFIKDMMTFVQSQIIVNTVMTTLN